MRRARLHRRGFFVLVFALGLVLLLQTLAWADSDVFQNIGPEPQVLNGLADKWPLGNYGLDTHVDGIKSSLTGGVDTSDLPASIAGFLAGLVWKVTAFLANTVITVLTFAFSLDLLNGSAATGGAGALAPISEATRNIYDHTFGEDWMVVGVLLAAFWAMWRGLVQRRHAEVAGALAMSLIFAVVALAFILRPAETIGQASMWTNRMAESVLSISKTGEPGSEQEAKRSASDQLFKLLVFDPWVVLNFGGAEHCVKNGGGDDPESVAVNPLAADADRDAQLRRQLAAGDQVSGDGKTCVNNANKYAAHFLRWSPGDLKRSNDDESDNSAYTALRLGKASKLPDGDPEKASARFGPEDKPAADQMQAGGQFNRFVVSLFIFFGSFGAFLVLAAMAFGVIMAGLIVLFLLAFTPVVAVLAILPGRGHELFINWLQQLGSFLLRKFVYSLVIVVLLAVGAALAAASVNMGWFLSALLQYAFFWTIFFYRKEIVGKFNQVISGARGGGGDVLRRLQGVYYSGMMLRRPAGAAAGVVGGAVAAPVAVPLAVVAARTAKRRAAERAANESRRAAGERQDLADRISSALRPPEPPEDGRGPGDGEAPQRPSGPASLPLVRRFPAPRSGGRGPGESVDTSASSNGRQDDGRPVDGDPGAPGGRTRGGEDPTNPRPRGSADGGGERGVPPPPPPARPSARERQQPPDSRTQPVSLSESLAADEARLRDLREARDAADRARDAGERRDPRPPRRPPRPDPPRRPDDEGRE